MNQVSPEQQKLDGESMAEWSREMREVEKDRELKSLDERITKIEFQLNKNV